MIKFVRRFFRRPSNPAGNLYYARLKAGDVTFYKVGYTSKATLLERLTYGRHGDEKLLDKELLFSFRTDAYDVEQRLLKHFRKHLAFGEFSNDPRMPLAGRGQGELFLYDVLGLDDDLYKLGGGEYSKVAKSAMEDQMLGCLFIIGGLVLAPFTLGISLIALLVGGSAFFGTGAKAFALEAEERKAGRRPKHPPEIHALLEELKKNCSLRKVTAAPG